MNATLAMLLVAGTIVPAEAQDPAGAEPRFTAGPTASKAGDSVRIDFAVDRETDVAVSVENAAGETVRHLVAGKLGKNPPAPLKAASLTQSVAWDGKDDDGQLASGGPFKVRVALGLRPTLENYLFNSPDAIGHVDCLGVDKEGNLYLSSGAGGPNMGIAHGMWMRVFDRQGRYLRTILPFPPDLRAEKLKGTGAFEADGRLHPLWHETAHMRMYPHAWETYGHELTITPKSHVFKMVLGGPGGPGGYVLRCINADGSVPTDVPFSGSSLNNAGAKQTNQRAWFTISPDEKWVYAAGVVVKARQHAVFRAPVDGSAPGAPFLGSPEEPGSDDKHFNHPTGVAVDGKGYLYVSDFGNNRIQVFKESDGRIVDSIPIQGPTTVQVHPKSGAIYVLVSEGHFKLSVVKLSGRQNPKVLARASVGQTVDERYAVMALDATSEPAVLYTGGQYGSHGFQRIEDKGPALEVRQVKTDGPWAGACAHLTVCRKRDELYFSPMGEQFVRLDLKTGKTTPLGMPGTAFGDATQLVPSPDGNTLYTYSHYKGLQKFDRDFKPVNFEALGKNKLDVPPSPMTFTTRGLAVAPNGDLYVTPIGKGPGYCCTSSVQVFRPDGTRKGTAVWRLCEEDVGPRFDRRGNLYFGMCVKEPGKPIPDFFAGRLPPFGPENPQPQTGAWSSATASTSWIYGSIVKFPPSGGVFWYAPHLFPGKGGQGEDIPPEVLKLPKVKVQSKWKPGMIEGELQGAEWYYYGASPFASRHSSGSPCNCQGSGFDVDDFGRSFFPDAGRSRVGILDPNGNEVAFFGQYGNRDDVPCPVTGNRPSKDVYVEVQGRKIYLFDKKDVATFNADPARYAKRAEKWPKIAFGYPYYVAVSRTHVFVGDGLNNRIAKLRLGYAAEGTCAAP